MGFRPVRVASIVILLCAAALLVLLGVHGPVDGSLNEGLDRAGRWPRTANTDWCEPNYQITPYIAEFGNSLSSLSIIANGIYGTWMHWASIECQYIIAFSLFIVIGLGSALFHGTLMREFQLMDELPMLWANGVFIFCVLTAEDRVQKRRPMYVAGVALMTALMTGAVVLFDTDDQTIFLLCYGSGVSFLIYRSKYLDDVYNSTRQVILLDTSICCYVGGFLAWLIDRLFCNNMIVGLHIRSFHLHSLWHLGAGAGTFSSVLFWIWTRNVFLKKEQALRGKTPVTQWIQVISKAA